METAAALASPSITAPAAAPASPLMVNLTGMGMQMFFDAAQPVARSTDSTTGTNPRTAGRELDAGKSASGPVIHIGSLVIEKAVDVDSLIAEIRRRAIRA